MKRILLLALVLVLAGAGVVRAGWRVDSRGVLVFEGGVVLSDEDGGSSGSGSSGSGSSGSSDSSGSSGESGSSGSGSTETRTVEPTTGAMVRTEERGEEARTEVRFGEGERIRTRVENGETRTDVWSGGVRVRFEQKDGRMIIKAEQEDGEEVELGEEEIFKIEERLDKDAVRVATGSGNRMMFARGQFGATTTLPISVDLETNSLIVTTPAGVRTVTVLPETAVANLLAANVIDRLGVRAVAEAARAGELTGVSGIVPLGERNGVPVYEVEGLSDQRIFGFIPVVISRTVTVSAETGEIVGKQMSFLDRVVDAVAF